METNLQEPLQLTRTERRPQQPRSGTNIMLLSTGVLIASAVGVLLAQHTNWPREALFMAVVFAFAAFLWATEALPIFATALLTITLQIILISNPGQWKGFGFESGKSPGYQEIIRDAADPVLLLFFGGFILARAASKEGVDRALSSLFLAPFGRRPIVVSFGLMVVTAVFSMWMSNSATTAMMLTLASPILAQVPHGDPFRKMLVLAVPFAANIGGIGTPIGSPPNAVALGFLQKSGYSITFLEWMMIAIPFAVILLAITWALLWFFFPARTPALELLSQKEPLSPRGWFVVGVFTATAFLWISDTWHGIPSAVVALIPAVAFTVTRLLDHKDINSLEWNILILIAGGISLGAGIQQTGLDDILLSYFPARRADEPQIVAGSLVFVTILFGTFMSNTATANLLLPIGISSGSLLGESFTIQIAFSIAIAASMSMALPISTPPNSLAYGTGEIKTSDMARVGALVGIIGGAIIVFLSEPLLRLWRIVE